MWRYKTEQREWEIGNVKVGGNPGERAIVLVGSIFYRGHDILKNDIKGIFDKKKAENLINLQDDFSDKTGNPCMIDLVGTSSEAIIKELDFVAKLTDAPIILDSPDIDVRLVGLRYAEEIGLINRIVYNSIISEIKQNELKEIKESKLESAILLAYTNDLTLKGKIEVIDTLLSLSNDIDIKKPLIDTCVLDVPSLGVSCKAIFDLKNKIGLPVGAGTHNAIGTWKGLLNKMGKQAYMPCSVSTAILAASVGADFILYGPIDHAKYFFPAISMLDAAYGQLSIEEGKMPSLKHPLFKIA